MVAWDEQGEFGDGLDEFDADDDFVDGGDGGLGEDGLGGLMSARGLIEVHKWHQRLKWQARMLAALAFLPFEGPLGRLDYWRKRRKWEKARERREEVNERKEFMRDPELEGLLWQYDEERQDDIFDEWKSRKEKGEELPSWEVEYGDWEGGMRWSEDADEDERSLEEELDDSEEDEEKLSDEHYE